MGTEPSINDLNSPWFTFAPPRRWQPTAAKFAGELCEASRVINWVLKETVLEITWDMAILLKCGQDKPTRAEIPALNYGHVRDILTFSNIEVKLHPKIPWSIIMITWTNCICWVKQPRFETTSSRSNFHKQVLTGLSSIVRQPSTKMPPAGSQNLTLKIQMGPIWM